MSGQSVPVEELEAPLRTILAQRRVNLVHVSADTGRRYQEVIEAVDVARGAAPRSYRPRPPDPPTARRPRAPAARAQESPALPRPADERGGNIWVALSRQAKRMQGGPAGAADEWVEEVAFDGYEPDGRYLGIARAPDGFRLEPAPVFRGDTAWTVAEDADGVQYIERYQIVRTAR